MASLEGGTTVLKVEIVVSSNQDPTRIAELVMGEIVRIQAMDAGPEKTTMQRLRYRLANAIARIARWVRG